jgi:hypothetical protein
VLLPLPQELPLVLPVPDTVRVAQPLAVQEAVEQLEKEGTLLGLTWEALGLVEAEEVTASTPLLLPELLTVAQ